MSVIGSERFDTTLVRAITGGAGALPADLGKLRGYLQVIGALLEEKAVDLEPTWEQACASAAEIAILYDLEASVAERAAAIRAGSMRDVRTKLAIWRRLAPTDDVSARSPRDRLILSIETDLERLGH